MTWLVTGGAGYIGSHVVRRFEEHGIEVVVVDDLSSGHREFVGPDVPFVEGTILDATLLRETFTRFPITGVVHVAGFKYAGVSVSRPLHTYEQNVTGTATLLAEMQHAHVDAIVFSSSAAVYGNPSVELITESAALEPVSPYGETKLIGEWLLRDQAVAEHLRHTSLRYFNVVGSGYDDLYDSSPHNLFPLVFQDLLAGRAPQINGDDYPTPDGTCVRDYIHVADLAEAHVVAAERLIENRAIESAYNLGSGTGISVREIMNSIRRVTGIEFAPTIAPRRPGDPARIVASGDLASRDLDWRMRHSLDEMVAGAWRAVRSATE